VTNSGGVQLGSGALQESAATSVSKNLLGSDEPWYSALGEVKVLGSDEPWYNTLGEVKVKHGGMWGNLIEVCTGVD
jgi:hypothetical protein